MIFLAEAQVPGRALHSRENEPSYGVLTVRIGTSDLPAARVRELDNGPYPVVLLAAAPGGWSEKARLHHRYSTQRLRGEWFQLTADQVALLVHEMQRADEPGWPVADDLPITLDQ